MKLFMENITCTYKQCVPGLALGREDGGGGEGPGNEADTMKDCIDSALCVYGFMLKSSDFHNGDLLNSALYAILNLS